MTKPRILVADPSEGFRQGLVKAILAEDSIAVVGQTGEGGELLNLIQEERPDLILMELNLGDVDGIEVLERLPDLDLGYKPYILVLSGFLRDTVTHLIAHMGVDYYLVKPCHTSRICRRIEQLVGDTEEASDYSVALERQVSMALQSMGMPAHVQGYQYLRWSILAVMSDPDLMRGVTKILYPMVAKAHHSTPPRVERSIRHAINMAWTRGDKEVIYRYFGNTISSRRGKPTNSEFIAMIADKLRLQQRIY